MVHDRRGPNTFGRRVTDVQPDPLELSRQLLQVQGDVEQLKSVIRTLTDAVQALTATRPAPSRADNVSTATDATGQHATAAEATTLMPAVTAAVARNRLLPNTA